MARLNSGVKLLKEFSVAGSKKFRDKLCVYCRDKTSTTADHVFPREFFQISERDLLPKVPSCSECNNKKSQIEHYLTTVLPFGATHPNAEKALSIDAAKRLSKNRKLHKKLQSTFSHKLINDSNEGMRNAPTISIEPEKVHDFCAYVGLGLLWHHWKIYLPLNYSYRAFTPSQHGLEFIDSLFNLTTNFRVHEKLGDETIQYKGIASEIDDCLSVWAIQLLGGITVADNELGSVFKNSFVAVITGSEEHLEKLELV